MTATQIKNETLSYLEAISGELYPTHQFVAAYGREEAHKALWTLWREKKVRLVAISDYRDATSEELADSIPGVEETLFYAKAI